MVHDPEDPKEATGNNSTAAQIITVFVIFLNISPIVCLIVFYGTYYVLGGSKENEFGSIVTGSVSLMIAGPVGLGLAIFGSLLIYSLLKNQSLEQNASDTDEPKA